MHVLHAVLPGMVDRRYGRVVCMASDAARLGQARLSYCAAAKAGVIALVKSIAQERRKLATAGKSTWIERYPATRVPLDTGPQQQLYRHPCRVERRRHHPHPSCRV